jgi:hypothetical protein
MITRLIIFLAMTSGTTVFAQSKKETEIVAEGNKLYRSEMASWYGTDIFLQRFASKQANSRGYFSYINGDKAICIFFSKSENPRVLATISFDSTYNVGTAEVDSVTRDLTALELDLYAIRKLTLTEIRSDTLFKTYKNTSLNLIPLSDENGKRVYVLTGPKNNGEVIFGNDYLLRFDNKGRIDSKSKLHKGLIPIGYGSKDGKIVVASMHSHLPGYSDYITATDICTLRLYEPFSKWEQHIVISKDFVSVWECQTNRLLVLTKKAWEKIYNTEKESNKN